jgi:hypothetical protein
MTLMGCDWVRFGSVLGLGFSGQLLTWRQLSWRVNGAAVFVCRMGLGLLCCTWGMGVALRRVIGGACVQAAFRVCEGV